MYESKPCNLNHKKGAGDRGVRDRIGRVVNVVKRHDGLWGTLQVLRSSPYAEMVFECAERMPECMGLSHTAQGRERCGPKGVVIEAVTEVTSVDLVADYASTRGLAEGLLSRGPAGRRGGWVRDSAPRPLAEVARAVSGPDTAADHVKQMRRRHLAERVSERLAANGAGHAARRLTEMAEAGLLGPDGSGSAMSGISGEADVEARRRAKLRKHISRLLAYRNADLADIAARVAKAFDDPDSIGGDEEGAQGYAANESRRGYIGQTIEAMRAQAGLSPAHVAVQRQLREAAAANFTRRRVRWTSPPSRSGFSPGGNSVAQRIEMTRAESEQAARAERPRAAVTFRVVRENDQLIVVASNVGHVLRQHR
jgi:hypothetical protein